MVNFRHGGGQVLMGGEMALMTLDGGGSPPIPPHIGKPCSHIIINSNQSCYHCLGTLKKDFTKALLHIAPFVYNCHN